MAPVHTPVEVCSVFGAQRVLDEREEAYGMLGLAECAGGRGANQSPNENVADGLEKMRERPDRFGGLYLR